MGLHLINLRSKIGRITDLILKTRTFNYKHHIKLSKMKVYNKRHNPKFVLTVLALCATTLIVGCSKKDEPKDLFGDGTKLIVNVMGITDLTEVEASKLKASAADMPTIKGGEIMPKEMINFEAFDAQVSLTKDELKKRPVSIDRKSTRLNSSHVKISYAVFCLKKHM